VNVWDVDGNRYVDLTSAFGVASLGHAHPAVVAAIRRQSGRLCHAMGDVQPSRLKAELCSKLSLLTWEHWTKGREKSQALLCNSGFEAVEAALKTARLFTGKRGVIAFEGAYHGLGYGTLEPTWRKEFREPFRDQLGRFAMFAPYPRRRGAAAQPLEEEDLRAMEERIHGILRCGEIGAILVEPIQGRGGEVIPPAGFLPMLRRICDRKHLLFIADEIYTGFWRTGRRFAVEHAGVRPDLICLGKALTGCLPLSACVGRAAVMAAWPESKGEALHTSTFQGNPVACAAALASIAEFEAGVGKWKIPQKGERWLEKLRAVVAGQPAVKEVRGVGLLLGIELDASGPGSAILLSDELLRRGVITLSSGCRGEVLALTPPLCVEEPLLDWCAGQIGEVIRKL